MNKNIILTFILIISFSSLISQNQQVGLLWKISGNGLTKPSYIYGNMHVSSKIAFRLGEEFYESINIVDKIALESNPIIWLNEIMNSKLAQNYIGEFDLTNQNTDGFYKNQFRLYISDNEDFSNALSSEHYFMNWLLYRENKSNSDFEEETFLDMFIYQAGAKNKKEVLSLEDFRENTKIVELSSLPDMEDKVQSQWFIKLTKEKSYGELLEEAYRKQDLSLIDSLQKEVSSNNGLYYMLYVRNEKMVWKIDSILKSGTSLFSGVGAAHLPGEKGMLKLLESMGYTVTAMPITFSDKARTLREEFDNKKLPLQNFTTFTTDLFSVDVPVAIYETPYSEMQRQWFGPELTNGSHFTIKQISTLSYFKGVSQDEYFQKFDSLLFENIPGKIESKTVINNPFYKGFDIINKTKNGDYQRYNILITPMNIFIFKMGGKDDFVLKQGDKFFKSIKLKNPEKEWIQVSPLRNDFSVNVPNHFSLNYNTKISNLYGHPILEAWDVDDSSYYLVQRRSLFYFSHLEEDEFELKRIAEQFFIKMELDSVKAIIVTNQTHPTAIAYGFTRDSVPMAVKVIINGPYYYLLAAISNNKSNQEKFFDSFLVQNFKYLFSNEIIHDSTTMLSLKSNYLLPTPIEYTFQKAQNNKRNKNKTEDLSFQETTKTEHFYSETYEKVIVTTKKFHIYESYENIDSLWNREILKLLKSSEKNSSYNNNYSSQNEEAFVLNNYRTSPDYVLLNRKKLTENGFQVLYVSISDTNTSRAYHYKFILNHGLLFKISAMGDTSKNQSDFILSFFNSAQPFDTIAGRSLFEDKASLFFASIYGNDSLSKVNALQSTFRVRFKAKDIDSLKLVLNEYRFPAKYIDSRKILISKLIKIKEFDDMDYIEELYKKAGDTSMYQIEILHNLALKGTKKSISTYLKLLNFDVPISGDKWNNGLFIYPLRYNLTPNKPKSEAFPSLLNYTFIDKYREAIISTIAQQVDSNFINPSVYKKNISQLLREAKIVLKEEISYEQTQQAQKNQNNYSSSKTYEYRDNDLLISYATVLIPHYKNKDVKEFLSKFNNLKNYTIRNEVFCRMQKSGIEIDSSVWNQLADDPINLSSLYESMTQWKIADKFPMKFMTQEKMAKSLLFQTGFNFKEDSIIFIEKRFLNDSKDSGFVYFFKTKSKGKQDWVLNYIGYQPKDANLVNLSNKVTERNDRINKSIPIKEIIDEKVNILILRHRPHADGSEDRQNYGYYY